MNKRTGAGKVFFISRFKSVHIDMIDI